MDLRKIIHELELEKQRLDEAILALEKLANGKDSRRTRSLRSSGNSHPSSGHEHVDMPTPASPALPA